LISSSSFTSSISTKPISVFFNAISLSKATACAVVLGKPSNKKPFASGCLSKKNHHTDHHFIRN
jgi:hypothetical protein